MISQIPASVISFIKPTAVRPGTVPAGSLDKPHTSKSANSVVDPGTSVIDLGTTAAARRKSNSLLTPANLQKVTALVQGIAELISQIRQTIDSLRSNTSTGNPSAGNPSAGNPSSSNPAPGILGGQSQPGTASTGGTGKAQNPGAAGAPVSGNNPTAISPEAISGGQPVANNSPSAIPAAAPQLPPGDPISALVGLTQRLQEMIQSLGQIVEQITSGSAFSTPIALAQTGAEQTPPKDSSWGNGLGTLLDIGLSLLPFGSIAKGAKGLLSGAGKLFKKFF